MLRQAIYGDRHDEAWNFHPLFRNGNNRAGHHHGEHAHLTETGKNLIQLAVTNQRLSTDQRDL